MPKTLVVFYSRTGTTRKIGQKLAADLGAETEEIIAEKDRAGAIGYMISGREAMKKIPAKIKPTQKNPAEYDLVIIGTPIWGWNLSSPVRAYLGQNRNNFKKVAFFCTMGGSGFETAFSEMEMTSGQKPIATLALKTKEVLDNAVSDKIADFEKNLK